MSKLRELLFKDQATGAKTSEAAKRSAQAPHQDQSPGRNESTAAVPAQNDSQAAQRITSRIALEGTMLGKKAENAAERAKSDSRDIYHSLKSRIHTRLVESIDINALMQIDDKDDLEDAIGRTVRHLISEEKVPLSAAEKERVAQDVLYETLGLGPLEPLLADPEINDILVNGADSVWVDRNGLLKETDVKFADDDHLLLVINRIVARIGRRVDEASPIVDARLPDGSRVNAIIPPLSLDGPILSIRRFRPTPFRLDDLIEKGTLDEQVGRFLSLAVKARLNILVSGGTSAGKTTLLNVLSGYISNEERIVTIEDTAELRMQQKHVVRLESRPSNIEGVGAISQRELVKNALRMRPDRIVVGEVRGPEALDMLQAMNTGHEGSITTVHANSPRDALSRIETLVLLAGVDLSQRSIREQIGSAFDLVVQIKRLSDGSRKVVNVAEITGVEEGVISMQDLFTFRQTDLDKDGRVLGVHRPCGLRPFTEGKFKDAHISLENIQFTTETEHAGEKLTGKREA